MLIFVIGILFTTSASLLPLPPTCLCMLFWYVHACFLVQPKPDPNLSGFSRESPETASGVLCNVPVSGKHLGMMLPARNDNK